MSDGVDFVVERRKRWMWDEVHN